MENYHNALIQSSLISSKTIFITLKNTWSSTSTCTPATYPALTLKLTWSASKSSTQRNSSPSARSTPSSRSRINCMWRYPTSRPVSLISRLSSPIRTNDLPSLSDKLYWVLFVRRSIGLIIYLFMPEVYNLRRAASIVLYLSVVLASTVSLEVNCSNYYTFSDLPDYCDGLLGECHFPPIINTSLIVNQPGIGEYGLCLDLQGFNVTISGDDDI